MNRNQAIDYLTRCADANGNHWHQGRIWAMSNCPNDIATCPTCRGTNDAGHLACPGSRYGYRSADVAAVAYRHWRIVARNGSDLSIESLEHSMSLAVNDSPSVESDLHEYAAELAGADIDSMVRGYLDCQLWAQHDYDRSDADSGNGPMLDENYDVSDVSDDYVDTIRSEFAALVYEHPLAVRMYGAQRRHHASDGNVWEHFGHDYYLTREHHGAGFWDRGLGTLGDYLTKIAHYAGSADDLSDNGNGVLVA